MGAAAVFRGGVSKLGDKPCKEGWRRENEDCEVDSSAGGGKKVRPRPDLVRTTVGWCIRGIFWGDGTVAGARSGLVD